MKNNKGFIAISLIYSFFLVFLVTLLMIALNYAKNRILTEDEEETLEKLNLIKCVKQTIFNALNLIGVIPPEKM